MKGSLTITGFADEIANDAAEQIAGLQAADVSHIEVRGVHGTGVLRLTDDEVKRFRGQLADAGICVSCIGSPIGKVQVHSDLEQHFNDFTTALQRAQQFDCKFVRLFSFYHKDESAEDVRDVVVAQLRRMAAAAMDAGVTLLHENEAGIYGDTPERCLDLLTAVDSPCLQAAFDPANFVNCGASTLAAWELLSDRVRYFHIKDAVAATGRVVPAGLGDGHLEDILRSALAGGFAGFASIEPHLKADDPDYGGDGAARFALATSALRALLQRMNTPA